MTELDLFRLPTTNSHTTLQSSKFLLGTQRPDDFGVALQQCTSEHVYKPIKTLSLFSGGGGLDIGFHDVGFDVQTMVEVDPRFATTLKANCGLDGCEMVPFVKTTDQVN